jgi:hypothetical protein
VANAFIGGKFQVFAAERMAVACGEIGEGHLVGPTDFGLQMMDFASESVRWKPFAHCVSVEECPINSLWSCPKNAVELDGI